MVQIINRAPTIGETLGKVLGQGISGIGEGVGSAMQTQLTEFFQNRKEQQSKKQLAGVLEQLGLAPELAALPSDLQKEFIKNKFQKDKFSEIMEVFGGLEGGEGIVARAERGPTGQITPEQILATTLIDPPLGKALQSQQEAGLRVIESKAKREFERAKPILARADERAEVIPAKEGSLKLMENAIEQGNLGFFSPDNLAELTGIEAFRTPSGAQFISSGKEFFLGSIKRAGARPNIFIEKQIQKMLPKIGRSKEANLTVMAALKSEIAVEKEYQDILNRMVDEDEAKYGYIKGNIGQRSRIELQKFAEKEQDRLEQELKLIQKDQAGKVQMRDPSGALRSVSKSDAKAAQKAGYTLVK